MLKDPISLVWVPRVFFNQHAVDLEVVLVEVLRVHCLFVGLFEVCDQVKLDEELRSN